MTDTQYQVQQAIDRLVESGAERGLQVDVYRHGEPVVDAVAGVADPTTERPVTSDTLFFSYSIGKGVASTVVHVLTDVASSITTRGSPSCGRSSVPTARRARLCGTR